jgi:uncharacterized protein
VKRKIIGLLAVLLLVVGLVYAAGGWYFSGRIDSGALAVRDPSNKAVKVVEATAHTVTLSESGGDIPALEADMTYGLVWDGGHGEVSGPPVRIAGSDVTRAFRVTAGKPPTPRQSVAVDRELYSPDEDPGDALGAPVREVHYTSPAGRFGAWFVPGRGDTWVIFTHGALGSDRSEALRAMRATVALHMPSLAIQYRNDDGAPADPSDRYQYGRTEWHDLEGAVRYALDHHAGRVVLVGYSMGGAITAAFLQHSPLAAKVAGVVLDSPMLDLSDTIDYAAEQLRFPVIGSPPRSLVWVAERIAGFRYDLDWDAVNYLDDPSWLRVPTLVFQGDKDLRTPVSSAEELLRSHPKLVTLMKVEGAGHVEAWNTSPQSYERELTAFLSRS